MIHALDLGPSAILWFRLLSAPDYESGGQEFESLRARQQHFDAIILFLMSIQGLSPLAIYIATLSPRYEIATRCCKSLKRNENVCNHGNKNRRARKAKTSILLELATNRILDIQLGKLSFYH